MVAAPEADRVGQTWSCREEVGQISLPFEAGVDAHGALSSRVCLGRWTLCCSPLAHISPQLTSLPAMSSRDHLRTLPAIRERCSRVFSLGQQGKLEYFTYHADKEPGVIDYCTSIIKVRRLRSAA